MCHLASVSCEANQITGINRFCDYKQGDEDKIVMTSNVSQSTLTVTLEYYYTPGRGILENMPPKGQTLCRQSIMGAEGDIMWPAGGIFSSGMRPGVWYWHYYLGRLILTLEHINRTEIQYSGGWYWISVLSISRPRAVYWQYWNPIHRPRSWYWIQYQPPCILFTMRNMQMSFY